jgi:Family of unknown function (DUF6232)
MENTFNERGVTITRNGIGAGGQVFALRDIEDVRVVIVRKNKTFPLALSIIGAGVAAAGGIYRAGAGLALGVMLVVVGVLAWYTQDVTHRLVVKTPSGEREAVSSPDLEFLARVEQALRAALAKPESAAQH